MMQPYLEVDEFRKLHHNARILTVNAAPPFTPVNLRRNHLTKEDSKHLGYNVGKFLRSRGGVIDRFVKTVFEKLFESTNVRTIEQKLRESKSTKERIPIHIADQMDKLFAHFQGYVNINPHNTNVLVHLSEHRQILRFHERRDNRSVTTNVICKSD